MDESLRVRIQELVARNEVLLFMKGTRHFPQCGFSAQVIGILNELGPKYETVNILADGGMREGMKEFSSWPTFPQLYVRGSFVGGCDIVREMHSSGELRALMGGGAAEPAKPIVVVATPSAISAFRDALADAGEDVLRLDVTPEFQHDLHVAPKEKGDVEVKLTVSGQSAADGLALFVGGESVRRADGLRIDFVTTGGGGFKLENPNEPPRVKSMDAAALKGWLEKRARGDAKFELIDVRPQRERDLASIAEAKMLTPDLEAALTQGDPDVMLVFHCHHGVRSRAAAEHFLGAGCRNVWNLEGGIDAWSLSADPSVPRY